MKNRKGQVTIYLILGIVIVASFLIVLFLVSSLTSNKLSSEQRKVIRGVLEASAVNYYAQVCLENVLEEGLVLLGSQGKLYKDQGAFDDKNILGYLLDGGDNVSFGIKRDDYFEEAAYPCSNFYDLPDKAPRYCKYPAPPKTYRFGRKSLSTRETGPSSLKRQLESYIENKSFECLNQVMANGSIVQQLGYEITPSPQGPSATVIFSGTATAVNVDFPLNVEVGGRDPVVQFLNWRARKEIRLKLIWTIVDEILQRDYLEIDFDVNNVENDASTEFYKNKGSILFAKRDLGSGDVLEFNDTIISNNPYVFKIVRQNRPPALEWVSNNESLFNHYDYLVIQGERIEMAVEAADPDEDDISYDFDGLPTGGTIEGNNFSYPTIALSPQYINMTVNVSDGELNDWQIVRVLIEEALESNFTVFSKYLGFENHISIEDPIYLDSSSTKQSWDPEANYTFIWSRVPGFYNVTEKECIILPSGQDCSETSFDFNITNINTSLKNVLLVGAGSFRLLTVLKYSNRSQTDDTSNSVPIKECIPYRNNFFPYPYPYHRVLYNGSTANNNPFYANHTCCTENFEYAGEDTICFRNEKLYCLNESIVYKNVSSRKCDGKRGNVCGGEFESEAVNTQKCGNETIRDCESKRTNLRSTKYRRECENQDVYSVVTGGWCYGSGGCAKLCRSEIVAPSGSSGDLEPNQNYHCGCGGNDDGLACDHNFDGNFDRTCQGGDCA